MARHRSPSGQRPNGTVANLVAQHQHNPTPGGSRKQGAHRLGAPGPAARGRLVAAAVAVGAVAAATQGADQPEAPQDATALALSSNVTAFSGLGGNAPAPSALPLPEVMPAPQAAPTDDVASLAKGVRIAEDREAAAARAEAERLAAEEAARKKAEAERAAAAEAQRLKQLQVVPGSVVMPAAGRLTSGFGARWGTTHYGIDIANSIGTPIRATTDGVVIESGPASGFGLWVRIKHDDGTVSVYGHINESMVSEGQRVSAGEQIATMGNRGNSTGPHLHFEIWLDGERKVDPLSWLRTNGVKI